MNLSFLAEDKWIQITDSNNVARLTRKGSARTHIARNGVHTLRMYFVHNQRWVTLSTPHGFFARRMPPIVWATVWNSLVRELHGHHKVPASR